MLRQGNSAIRRDAGRVSMAVAALAACLAGAAQAQDFTTAAEVKPILTATKANWIALREYEGQDLLYFTQIISWRCGLSELRYAVNGAAPEAWPLHDCVDGTGQPANAIMPDTLLYATFNLGSVAEVTVTLVYDDGSEDTATYARAAIVMP
ncbi:MAG: hypothetical protein Q8Q26_02575 [Pseudorhodobacter sp.]|nr:hypothetical protein [Pseudorhodobacter sp.]